MATKISDLHKEWSKDAEYSNAYEALSLQYELAQRLNCGAEMCPSLVLPHRNENEN